MRYMTVLYTTWYEFHQSALTTWYAFHLSTLTTWYAFHQSTLTTWFAFHQSNTYLSYHMVCIPSVNTYHMVCIPSVNTYHMVKAVPRVQHRALCWGSALSLWVRACVCQCGCLFKLKTVSYFHLPRNWEEQWRHCMCCANATTPDLSSFSQTSWVFVSS